MDEIKSNQFALKSVRDAVYCAIYWFSYGSVSTHEQSFVIERVDEVVGNSGYWAVDDLVVEATGMRGWSKL